MALALTPWILIGLIFSPIFYQLYGGRWAQIDYTHAYFVLPLCALIVYSKRERLQEILSPHTTPATAGGLTLIAGGAGMFILGWREGYLFLSTFSLLFFLFGVSLFLLGGRKTRLLLFPFTYLLLLIPVPLGILDQLTLPLRQGTSVVAEVFLRFLGYPIERDGLLLSIGNAGIYIGQPCSGFRSLVTLLSLGLLYIYFTRHPLKHKLILIASLIPLACLGNYLRVIVTCLIAYYWGNEAAEGFFHSFSGILIFLLMIFGMILIENFLTRRNVS